jgi:two-component system phosphate regulon response regulator OmpR
MSARILIIEDDDRLAAMLVRFLAENGFAAETRGEARGGLEALRSGSFDALVLDVMLPDLDGFEVCRRVRAESDVPIVMLTARGDETDRIVGLELGADDYLPKPFNPRELLARLRAVLRRREPSPRSRPTLRFGELEIDRDARSVHVRGQRRELTGHQFDLLCVLAESAGRAVTRDTLMEQLQGHPLGAFDRSIDVHVSRIRAAIEDDPKRPRRIRTVRGVGYLLAREGEGT